MLWEPNRGPQEEFFRRPEFEVMYGGARGGGKTDALVVDHVRFIHNPEYRGLLLRKTFPELREVVDRCHKYYKPYIATPDGGRIYSQYNSQEHVWTFSTGAKVELGSMHTEESKYKYIGRQFVRIGFDQLEQFSESQYDFMMGQSRTPVPELAGFTGVRSTANPGGPGHGWVKGRFIADKLPYKTYSKTYKLPDGREIVLDSVFIPAKVYDNPAISINNPAYIAQLMSLEPTLRKAWLDGDWDVFAGQFFTEFSSMVHGVKPFEVPKEWDLFGGLDYGEANPTSFGLYTVDPGNDDLYRIGEYYSPGVGPDHDREIQKTIHDCKWTYDAKLKRGRDVRRVYADPSMWITRKHDTGRIKSAALAMNHPLVKGTNDRINGWRAVKRLIHWDQSDKGEWLTKPKFFFFNDHCPDFERTIPTVIHAKEKGDPKAEDARKGGEDHCADEWRYMVMGYYGAVRDPGDSEPKPEERKDSHLEYYGDEDDDRGGSIHDQILRKIGR